MSDTPSSTFLHSESQRPWILARQLDRKHAGPTPTQHRELDGVSTHPYNHGKRLLVTPDWVNTLVNPRTRQASLFIGELDRGEEPLESSRRAESRADVKTKLDAFREFLEEGAFGRFSDEFESAFKGFRVLFVTSRPESILRQCDKQDTGGLVWIADKDKVTAENVLGRPIWIVPGLKSRQAILASTLAIYPAAESQVWS